jgi:hypothetical protein
VVARARAYAVDSDEIVFPSNVESFDYKRTIEYEYDAPLLNHTLIYHLEESLHYEILDVDLDDNTFSIMLRGEISLNYFAGIEPIAAEYTYSNDTKKRFPFSLHRSVSYTATRIVDLLDGKVMAIENEKNIPSEMKMVFRYEGETEEFFASISGGVSNVGYIASAWKGVYEDLSNSETILRSVPAGKFDCFISPAESDSEVWNTEGDYYYEKISGILIYSETTRTPTLALTLLGVSGGYERITELTNIENGRTWDKINVALSISDTRIDVNDDPSVIAMGTYAFDSAPFDGEIHLNSPTLSGVGMYNYTVGGVSDPLFGVTQYQSNEVTCIIDRVKISDGGVSNDVSKVKESETVWFKAVYEYDDEVFDGSKGSLEINGESGQWSETNKRWELVYAPDEPTSMTFEVTGIYDETYGLTSLNDIAGKQTIEWKSAGIPGFPYGAIILGLLLSAAVLMHSKRIG